MKNKDSKPKRFGIIGIIIQIVLFVAGGFLLYKNRQKLKTFLTRQNFLITAMYAILIGFIALFYRLIGLLNWLIQQAR